MTYRIKYFIIIKRFFIFYANVMHIETKKKILIALSTAILWGTAYLFAYQGVTENSRTLTNNLKSADQYIEKVVFVVDPNQRDSEQNITMELLNNSVIGIDKSIISNTSWWNFLSWKVENSFILGGKNNTIQSTTTTSWSVIGGGSGNSIENSNYAVILGGKNNTVSSESDESIILWGEGNHIQGGKGIIIGNYNDIHNTSTERETIVIGNNIAVTGSDNVLMGKDYQFSGNNSFVWSTESGVITGEDEFIIKNTHGMAINLEENEIEGIGLALKGSLKIWEKDDVINENIEGTIKNVGGCLCYNDGVKWKNTKNDTYCKVMCNQEYPKQGTGASSCASGSILHTASNLSGDYRSCIGSTGSTIVIKEYTSCHTGFSFVTENVTGESHQIFEGTGKCVEQTQYANCEGTKISANETLYFPSSIQQTWSGTMQEFLGRSQWYYNDTLISGTCAYTCNTGAGYVYKLDTTNGGCRKMIVTFDPSSKTWSTQGTVAETQKTYASGATLWTNKPNRSGYTFSGWYVKETAYVTDNRGKPLNNDKFTAWTTVNANTPVRTDLLLGAQWNANTYKINYVLDGGTPGEKHPASATFDQEFTVDYPTKDGFAFAWWDITWMDGTNHSYDTMTSTATGLSNTTAKNFKNLTAISGATITFRAQWSQNTYRLTYDLQGWNAVGTYPTTGTFGQAFIVQNPTKEGYTFKGWNIEGMDTTVHIVGGKTMSTTTASGITGTTFQNLTSIKNQEVHFTAQWEVNTHTLDVDGYLDNAISSSLWNYGTCSIYIDEVQKIGNSNGDLIVSDVAYGANYQITCNANDGYLYGGLATLNGYEGRLSGIFGDKDLKVAVIFTTRPPDPENGECSPTKYSCTKGEIKNQGETTTTYTWTCAGSNGGENVSCKVCKEHYSGTNCSEGETMSCPTNTIPSSHAIFGNSTYTFAGEIKTEWKLNNVGPLGACEYQCKTHFTGTDCHGERLSCGEQPENANIWSDFYTFAGQEKTWNYTGKNMNDLQECEFTCKEHYTRSGSVGKCLPNTQQGECTGLPLHATWNNANFVQIWNGTHWDPESKTAIFAISGECSYQCNIGYTGTDCHAQIITINYDDKNGNITTETATYDQDYTLLSAPIREGYSFLGRSGENKLYAGGAMFQKILVNKAITDGRSSIDFVAEWHEETNTCRWTITATEHFIKGSESYPWVPRPWERIETWTPGICEWRCADNYEWDATEQTCKFVPETYTITFDKQCATIPWTEALDIIYGRSVLSPITVPTKNWYHFWGYYTEENGNGIQRINSLGNWVNTTNTTFTSDTILYAFWGCTNGYSMIPGESCNGTCAPIKVTFQTNNCGTFYENNSTSIEINENYGQNYLFPSEPSIEGKEFIWWFTSANAGDEIKNQTKVIQKSDHILYAHCTSWKIDGECGNRYHCEKGVVNNISWDNSSYTWECEGSNGGTTVQCSEKKVYTLTFNSHWWTEILSQTWEYGWKWSRPLHDPERWIYNEQGPTSKFLWWFKYEKNGDEILYNWEDTIDADLTLHANYTCITGYVEDADETACEPYVRKYMIYYDANGWSPSFSEQRTEGQNITVTWTQPTREYHTFSGWKLSWSNVMIHSWTQISEYDIQTYGENDVLTLSAQWEIDTCSVTFDSIWWKAQLSWMPLDSMVIATWNCMEDLSFTYNDRYFTGTKTGYTFMWWYTDITDGDKLESDRGPHKLYISWEDKIIATYKNQTYYAHWKSNCWTWYIRTNPAWGSTPRYDEIPSNPYAWQTYQSWYTIYQWTCPTAVRCPTISTDFQTCNIGKYCAISGINTRGCYNEADHTQSVKCTANTGDDISKRSPRTVTHNGTDSCPNATWGNFDYAATTTTKCTFSLNGKTKWNCVTNNTECELYFSGSSLNTCLEFKNGLVYGARMAYYSTCRGAYNYKVTQSTWKCDDITITYHLEWGSPSIKQTIIPFNTTWYITWVIPTKAGYTFMGWSTQSWSTNRAYGPWSGYDKNTNLDLYAIWEPWTYKVLFYTNDGSFIGTVRNGSYFTIPSWKTRTIQWNFSNGRTVYVTLTEGRYKCEKELFYDIDETLYTCAWFRDYTQVGGTGELRYSQWLTQSPTVPQKDWYLFDGWYTTPQTKIPVYGVDENMYVITQDVALIGNPSTNMQTIKNTELPKEIKIWTNAYDYSPWTMENPLASGSTVKLYAHYTYNEGRILRWFFGKKKAENANGNRDDVVDQTNESKYWSKLPNAWSNSCQPYDNDKQCFWNSHWYDMGGDPESSEDRHTTKYNGTQTCKLNENDKHALGNRLNYLIGRYNDSRNGNYARREIVGCYFIFSHTDLDNSEYSTEYMIRHIFNVDNAKDTFIPIWAEWAWVVNFIKGIVRRAKDYDYKALVLSKGSIFSLSDNKKEWSYYQEDLSQDYRNSNGANKAALLAWVSKYRYQYNLR